MSQLRDLELEISSVFQENSILLFSSLMPKALISVQQVNEMLLEKGKENGQKFSENLSFSMNVVESNCKGKSVELSQNSVLAVSGIACPEAFKLTLENLGALEVESLEFHDHKKFTEKVLHFSRFMLYPF